MKHINIGELLDQVKNFGSILGPSEYSILGDATLLLKGQFPASPQDKAAYITRSNQVQGDLINLKSRIEYIFRMKAIERDTYMGNLISEKEMDSYNYRDRPNVTLSLDTKYRDLVQTVSVLEVIKIMVDDLLWSLKISVQKL